MSLFKKKNLTKGILDLSERGSNLKWIVLIFSALISLLSIWYTNVLVSKLEVREQKSIEDWAKAQEIYYKFIGSTNTEITEAEIFAIDIVNGNNEIPVILADSSGNVISTKNVDLPEVKNATGRDSIYIQEFNQRIALQKLVGLHEPMRIELDDNGLIEYQYLYYGDTAILTQLKYYPYIQLSIIAIFGFLAYLAFSYSQRSEQNRVWVGMAKETAHQLGTPLTSLMAWVEYLKIDDDFSHRTDFIDELEKDIARLNMITERFSNIGSVPILKPEKITQMVEGAIGYLRNRISTKVNITVTSEDRTLTAALNKPLFEWVIENLSKNAVDAMSGIGNLNINIGLDSENNVFIDIKDDGKGMSRAVAKEVFKPGFTTKKRGWGLGLTLVQRIVESYHRGRIWVSHSEKDAGTTFRILLINGAYYEA